MTDAESQAEIDGMQRYQDVSQWIKAVMGQLFQLAIALPEQSDFAELAVTGCKNYHTWRLRCTCSVVAHAGLLTQFDAQRAVTEVAVDDAEKTYWRHPYLDKTAAKAYWSGSRGNVSVHVVLETVE